MQVALTRDDYEGPHLRRHLHNPPRRGPRALGWTARDGNQTVSARSATHHRGLDVCRLLISFVGLSLYVGVPAVAIAYLASQLIP